MNGPTVGEAYCRGGCGRLLDLELHPAGECEECEAINYRLNEEPPRRVVAELDP